jgi:hypothetical protein
VFSDLVHALALLQLPGCFFEPPSKTTVSQLLTCHPKSLPCRRHSVILALFSSIFQIIRPACETRLLLSPLSLSPGFRPETGLGRTSKQSTSRTVAAHNATTTLRTVHCRFHPMSKIALPFGASSMDLLRTRRSPSRACPSFRARVPAEGPQEDFHRLPWLPISCLI